MTAFGHEGDILATALNMATFRIENPRREGFSIQETHPFLTRIITALARRNSEQAATPGTKCLAYRCPCISTFARR